MFGFEDQLLHKLASVANLFTANHMKERFWPVHVRLLQKLGAKPANSKDRQLTSEKLLKRLLSTTQQLVKLSSFTDPENTP
jgi:hypothetical protein